MNLNRGSLEDRIADLEAILANVDAGTRQVLSRPAAFNAPRPARLAVTCNDTGGSYPSSGNTFPIQLVDATFTEATGSQAVTKTPRSASHQFYARTLGGSFLPVGTLAGELFQNNRWWLFDPGISIIGKLSGILHAGSSQVVHVYTGAGGSEGDSGVTITAWDWLLSAGASLPTGTKVICTPANGLYYAESAEIQRIVFGTLSGTLTAGGSVSCSVTYVSDGATLSTITVHDREGVFTGTSGKAFAAVYCPGDDTYAFLNVAC